MNNKNEDISPPSPRLSQCMIVKNEEDNIQKALSWGKDVMWEQIVVDTGSTDRTVELAESMGAKVYHFPWIDDFSAAKNLAISKATGDWIAFLDADEYLTDEWASKLPLLLENLQNSDYLAIRSPLANINQNGEIMSVTRNCRFFRRKPGLLYQNPIHETLAFDGQVLSAQQIMDIAEEFPVYHTGYAPEIMEKKNKVQRNIELLKKELDKRPNDYNIMGYLGDLYEGDEAEQWYKMAVEHMPETISTLDERSSITFVYLLISLENRSDKDGFMEIYEKAIRLVPWVYDIDFLAGRFYAKQKDYEKAVFHLEKALKVADEYGSSAFGIYMTADIAGVWELLARCHYKNGSAAVCVKYCVSLLNVDNRRIIALTLLIRTLEKEKPEDVVRFLAKLYDLQQPSDRLFLLAGAARANAESVLNILKKMCTPEEISCLDRIDLDIKDPIGLSII